MQLVLRERYDDTVSEDWVDIKLIENYINADSEILSVHMLDRNGTGEGEEGIKQKYLLMMLSGGVFISVRLQTPLHSDTYLRALVMMEDD